MVATLFEMDIVRSGLVSCALGGGVCAGQSIGSWLAVPGGHLKYKLIFVTGGMLAFLAGLAGATEHEGTAVALAVMAGKIRSGKHARFAPVPLTSQTNLLQKVSWSACLKLLSALRSQSSSTINPRLAQHPASLGPSELLRAYWPVSHHCKASERDLSYLPCPAIFSRHLCLHSAKQGQVEHQVYFGPRSHQRWPAIGITGAIPHSVGRRR